MIFIKPITLKANDSFTIMISDNGTPLAVYKITVPPSGGVKVETQAGTGKGEEDLDLLCAALRVMRTHKRLNNHSDMADSFLDHEGNIVSLEISKEAMEGL